MSQTLIQRKRAGACVINGQTTDIMIIPFHSTLFIIITQQQSIGAVVHARNNEAITALGPRIAPLSELHSLIAVGLERELKRPITLNIALAPQISKNINTSAMIQLARQLVGSVIKLSSE